ncbi:MAG: hypothetical protein C0392_16190, partial [Syntrophus sp. (in: bacteria)]|nr:hypothetical protein [Syntrophus sp. (in: bacteria)]
MNSVNPRIGPQKNCLRILFIAATTIVAILISLYCLISRSFIVFQNLFYIPIILSCMYYTMRGFIYSVCLAVIYLLLILFFTSENGIIVQALVRVVLFIAIAGVVTFLSIQLKRAEREKSAILKGLKDIIVEFIDADMALIWGNDTLSELTGKNIEELKGDKCYTFLHGRTEPCPGCSAQKAMESGIFQEGEAQTPDGRPLMTKSFPIIDQHGKTVNVIHIAMDITERKRMEEALKENELTLRSLINATNETLTLIDAKGTILIANETMASRLGKNVKEITGNSAYDYFPSDVAEQRKEKIEQVVCTGKPVHFEDTRKDRTYELSAYPVLGDGNSVSRIAIYAKDVTERKRAEEALTNDQIRLTAVLDSIDAFVYVADFNSYELLFINEYGRKVWGDIAGQRCWETIQKGQEGPCKFCTNNRLLSDSGIPTGVYRWEFQNTRNGRWYYCRDQAIQWNDGRLVRLEIATDITEHKLAEEEIQNLLSEKELLLREVHHRIKNNMNVIMSLLSLQSGILEDNPSAVAALQDSRSRVQSMMVLYDKLYQSADFREISTKEYLTSLIDEIIMNFPNRRLVTIETHINDFILDAKTLSPVGMIVNELLTNIMKHAFIGRDNGV